MNDIERRALIGAAGIGAIAALSKAGPLNPPAGTVTPTGRTLDEIYNRVPSGGAGDGRTAIPGGGGAPTPLVISTPGSYVLTGNIGAAAGGGNAIQINADHVTLDLNGYSVSSGFNTGNGILISSGFKGIRVRNGLIYGFNTGVLITGSPSHVIIEDIAVREAKTNGIQTNNTGARNVVIRRCTIAETGASTTGADASTQVCGIQLLSHGTVVEDCTVSRILFNGTGTPSLRGILITAGANHVVQRCTVIGESIPTTGTAFSLAASSVRRNNTAVGFTTGYGGGIDGGGNV